MHNFKRRKLHLCFLIISLLMISIGRIFMSEALLLYLLMGIVFAVIHRETAYCKQRWEIERNAVGIQREETERLMKIVAIQRDIASASQDLQAAMQTIIKRTQEITHAEGGAVELVEGDEMVYRAVSGTAVPLLGMHLDAATSFSGRCVRENAVLVCTDTETDDRVDTALSRKTGVRSVTAVPLRQGGRAIGVLKMLSSRPHAFTEQDAARLELMAGTLSATISDALAMQVLRESQERLEEAQQIAQVGSWEYDVRSQKLTWSKELFRLTGLPHAQGEPDKATYLALYTPESAARIETCFQRALHDGISYTADLQGAIVPGKMAHWYHAVGKAALDSDGTVIRLIGTLVDITERKNHAEEIQTANASLVEANSQMVLHVAYLNLQSIELEAQKAELEASNARFEALATTDGLTGLKNRRAFQERLKEEFQRAVRYGRPLSVVLLDVDHFKKFNDTFGHPAGDMALIKVAEAIEMIGRSTDLIARYGGEEFVLVLPETDARDAVRTAERIRHAIANVPWKQCAITVSVGAATFPLQSDTAHALLNMADQALYSSKRNGRNRVTHASDLD